MAVHHNRTTTSSPHYSTLQELATEQPEEDEGFRPPASTFTEELQSDAFVEDEPFTDGNIETGVSKLDVSSSIKRACAITQ